MENSGIAGLSIEFCSKLKKIKTPPNEAQSENQTTKHQGASRAIQRQGEGSTEEMAA